MKKLRSFESFDCNRFFKGKKLLLNGIVKKENSDYYNGYVAELVIIEDNTDYGDETGLNRFEKFNIKLPEATQSDVAKLKVGSYVRIDKVSKAVVYRNKDSFTDNLSISGSIVPVQQ